VISLENAAVCRPAATMAGSFAEVSNVVAAIPFPRARDLRHNVVGVFSFSEYAPKVALNHRGEDTIPLGLNCQADAQN
jgi:hypothetical protein